MTNTRKPTLADMVNRINAYVATLTPQQKSEQFGDVHTDLIAATEIMSFKETGHPSPALTRIMAIAPSGTETNRTERRQSDTDQSQRPIQRAWYVPPRPYTRGLIRGLYTHVMPSARFVEHYYTGKGRPVTLTQMSIASQFEQAPSVRKAINAFLVDVRAEANRRGGKGARFSLSGTKPINVTWSPGQFALGNGQLSFRAICNYNGCQLNIKYWDEFKDPLDLEGVQLDPRLDWMREPGGTPYEITHRWTEQFTL